MSAVTATARWDIFCRVIDNFGDAGVSWRLARLLANVGGPASFDVPHEPGEPDEERAERSEFGDGCAEVRLIDLVGAEHGGLPDVEHEKREEDGEKDASFHLGRHWVVTRGAKRMAARKPSGGQPSSANDAVAVDRLGRVVRARRQKAAGARKIR